MVGREEWAAFPEDREVHGKGGPTGRPSTDYQTKIHGAGGRSEKLVPVKRPSRDDARRTIEAMRLSRSRNPVGVTTQEILAWKNAGRP